MQNNRRAFLGALAIGMLLPLPALADAKSVTVYKTPGCGCCAAWAEHLRAAGFAVEERETDRIASIKRAAAIPERLASCHTGFVDGFVLEGHVPDRSVLRLLRERPDVVGLAVPGMPIGSPGMEGPDPEPYAVIAFRKDGTSYIFDTIRPG